MHIPLTEPQLKRLGEIFRYGIGCALALLLKYLLTLLFNSFNLSFQQSYALAILIILAVSYTYHSHITFRYQSSNRQQHLQNLLFFSATLLFFNAIDYHVVTKANAYIQTRLQHTTLSNTLQNLLILAEILASSTLIFALRFLCYRFIFKRPLKKHS